MNNEETSRKPTIKEIQCMLAEAKLLYPNNEDIKTLEAQIEQNIALIDQTTIQGIDVLMTINKYKQREDTTSQQYMTHLIAQEQIMGTISEHLCQFGYEEMVAPLMNSIDAAMQNNVSAKELYQMVKKEYA